jgi:hypothetical protein
LPWRFFGRALSVPADRLRGLEHDPEKAAPDLIRGGSRFSEKIMLEQNTREELRFEEKSSRF